MQSMANPGSNADATARRNSDLIRANCTSTSSNACKAPLKSSGLPSTFSVRVLTSCGVPPTRLATASTTAPLRPEPLLEMVKKRGAPPASTVPVSRETAWKWSRPVLLPE